MAAFTNEEMREASGNVRSDDPLVQLLYLLGRDCLPLGRIEELIMQVEKSKGKTTVFTNGYLAEYCILGAKRLKGNGN